MTRDAYPKLIGGAAFPALGHLKSFVGLGVICIEIAGKSNHKS